MDSQLEQKLIEQARALATEAHKGQKRRDGKDYITHPEAVYEIVCRTLKEQRFSKARSIAIVVAKMTALLHDVFEDNKNYILTIENIQSWFPDLGVEGSKHLFNVLQYVTRRDEDYSVFIYLIQFDVVAMVVKLADLEHNLSDAKPGSQRDKYMLAQLYLKEALEATLGDVIREPVEIPQS
jgi:guanosine-3',5'-bis(diphosphate) 3'-pyrophosphohydrolase